MIALLAGSSHEITLAVGRITHSAIALEALGQHPHEHGYLPISVIVHTHLVFATAKATKMSSYGW